MSEHTKGPWHVAGADEDTEGEILIQSSEDTEGEILIQSSDGWYVATTCDGAKPDGSEIHNARLIAAAPDGLALAEHIVAMATDPYLCGHPEWEFIVIQAAALMDKAEGK